MPVVASDHDATGENAERTFNHAHVAVCHHSLYPRIPEEGFDVGEKHCIVGPDKFAHAVRLVSAYKCGNVPPSHRTDRSYNTKAVEISEENTVGVVVPLDAARSASESLAPLLEIVDADMDAINRIILDKAVSNVDLIPELAHHLIDSGGKRLRPMLAVAASRLCASFQTSTRSGLAWATPLLVILSQLVTGRHERMPSSPATLK